LGDLLEWQGHNVGLEQRTERTGKVTEG